MLDDEVVKDRLRHQIRVVRDVLVWKLDGLSEYDIRRPLTSTGTNLLGLVKHCAIWEARYLGEVFDRPFPAQLPRWDDDAAAGTDSWAAADERREEIISFSRQVARHSEATMASLALDASGYVPWWGEQVTLLDVMLHVLSDTTRHAGHADILREGLDGSVGEQPGSPSGHGQDESFWEERLARIEAAARAAGSSPTSHASS